MHRGAGFGGTVVQGTFLGGRPIRPPAARLAPAVQLRAVQPAAGGAFELPPDALSRSGPGQRLPDGLRQRMEALHGADFSDVRVHVGPAASAIGALAFTHGSDLYFAPGQYSPATPQGDRLIAHELTHVVQQRQGRVRNPFGRGVAVVQDQGLEAEAERLGLRTCIPASSPAAPSRGAAPAMAAAQAYRLQGPMPSGGGRHSICVTQGHAGTPVGSLQLRPDGSGRLKLTDLHVEPRHRRQGLATRLVQAALDTARRQGFAGVVLEARPGEPGLSLAALTQLYRMAGFRPAGISSQGFPVMESPAGIPSRLGGGAGSVQPAGWRRPPLVGKPATVVQRADSSDDEADFYRQGMGVIIDEEREPMSPVLDSHTKRQVKVKKVMEDRPTYNVTSARDLYKLAQLLQDKSITTCYVRIQEGQGYNFRNRNDQMMLYDSKNKAPHYTTVVNNLNVNSDDQGMAQKIKHRLAGTLNTSTVTKAQLEAMDLLLLLSICEGIRLDGNITNFLGKLDQIDGGKTTFKAAFADAGCGYVPARNDKGTGQEKDLRGDHTLTKRIKKTAHNAVNDLRDLAGLPKGKKGKKVMTADEKKKFLGTVRKYKHKK